MGFCSIGALHIRIGFLINSLLQQPGSKTFKLSKIELIYILYKAKKFEVPPFTI